MQDNYPTLFLQDYKDKSKNRLIPFENIRMLEAYAKVALSQNTRYRAFLYENGKKQKELVWSN